MQGVIALCFCNGKLVIVHEKNTWNLPGGTIEAGETYEQATVREVKEEANMKVLFQKYIGCSLCVTVEGREIRHVYSFCAVEPCGEFISDPDGDVSEIKLIDPVDVSKYLEGWAVIGEEIMRRALEMRAEYRH
jgi:ADP-ribose pyrophosphatase YjhB (NUDIX family)